MSDSPGPITALLAAYNSGDPAALTELTHLVLPELKRIARRLMSREKPGHLLRTTALVNEAFLRLFNGQPVPYEDTRGFFAAAVKHMRWVLTDYARKAQTQKRTVQPETPSEAANQLTLELLIDLSRALDEMEQHEPFAARVVELKFYAGLSIEEIAAVLDSSPRSVVRNWEWARAWLQTRLSGPIE